MLKDYAVSLTVVTIVLLGYTALLFSHKPEAHVGSSVRTEITYKSPQSESSTGEARAAPITN